VPKRLAHTVTTISAEGTLLLVPAGTAEDAWPEDVLKVVFPDSPEARKAGLVGQPVLGPDRITNPSAWEDGDVPESASAAPLSVAPTPVPDPPTPVPDPKK